MQTPRPTASRSAGTAAARELRAGWLQGGCRGQGRGAAVLVLAALFLFAGCEPEPPAAETTAPPPAGPQPDSDGLFHVHPGDDLQAAIDAAAASGTAKTVRIHAGVYVPPQRGQAFLSLTAEHDGVILEGVGDVVLSGCNPGPDGECGSDDDIQVSHVVYFGDGISANTVLRGVRISGARGYLGDPNTEPSLEPNRRHPRLNPGMFFYMDGGAMKVFGRSYPRIEQVIIEDNETQLCGGGVSIEQRGFREGAVRFDSCIFRNNRCPATGSAVDVLEGGRAEFRNCLFVGNVGNSGMDEIRRRFGLSYNAEHGTGALTVFPGSTVHLERCTFTENWNGVDDHGEGSTYERCLFWNNTAGDGSRPEGPYEFDILDASGVSDCWIGGGLADLRGSIDPQTNRLDAPDPEFDEQFRPHADGAADVGYRPVSSPPGDPEPADSASENE